MKILFFFSTLMISATSFGQDFIQTTAININEHYLKSIRDLRKIYEYEGQNLSIKLYQYPKIVNEDVNNISEYGLPSIIKINNFYLPINLGDENTLEVKNLVNGSLPEIILYSAFSCQYYCGTKTYIINLFEEKPFIISDLGLDVKIIDKKGIIKYFDYETIDEKTYEYDYPINSNEILTYEQMNTINIEEDSCFSIIQSIIYNENKGYSFGNIKWKNKTECVACFTGDMLVSINEHEKKPISNIKIGDYILTYDFLNKQNKLSRIENILIVPHNIYIEYHFEHDSIVSTVDHPFYLNKKGWCSFAPKETTSRYSNYDVVNKIEIGDYFNLVSGKQTKLIDYTILKDNMPSYTITKLSDGNCFYINDILVGVEEIYLH